ncbi:MAG: GAF domain-containing protein, partial [Sulfurospirillum cavolei]|nr:GAF domain-containing protein [Sulfurospirillum cavolei]
MTLYETATVVSNSLNLVASLEKALMILKNRLHLEKCVIHTLGEDNILSVYASIDFSRHQKELATYKLGEGVTGHAAESKEPVVIENLHNDMMFLNKSGNRDQSAISYIAVPMLVDQEVIGVLGASTTRKTAIDFESTIRVLTIL